MSMKSKGEKTFMLYLVVVFHLLFRSSNVLIEVLYSEIKDKLATKTHTGQ